MKSTDVGGGVVRLSEFSLLYSLFIVGKCDTLHISDHSFYIYHSTFRSSQNIPTL